MFASCGQFDMQRGIFGTKVISRWLLWLHPERVRTEQEAHLEESVMAIGKQRSRTREIFAASIWRDRMTQTAVAWNQLFILAIISPRCRCEVHTGFWWGNPKERDHLQDLAIGRRIMLKLMLCKSVWRACMGLTRLRIEAGGGLLRMLFCTLLLLLLLLLFEDTTVQCRPSPSWWTSPSQLYFLTSLSRL